MEKVDVFIPTTIKDINKVLYTAQSILMNIDEVNDIYISMPNKNNLNTLDCNGHKIYFFNDFEILPFADLTKCKFRPNWIFQQLLKLCQRVTKTNYTFICDSDIILTKHFQLFENDKPILHCRTKNDDESSFLRFIAKFSNDDLIKYDSLNGIGKTQTKYISDIMLFNNIIIDEMLKKYGYNIQSFVDFALSSTYWKGDIKTGVFISEYELYGMYIDKYFNDLYVKKDFNPLHYEKICRSQNQVGYTDDEIKNILSTSKYLFDYNAVKLQASCVASDITYKK